MSDGIAIDFAEVIQAHIFWVGALLVLARLL
jgi:hypothetical protein